MWLICRKKSKRQLKKERKLAREENAKVAALNGETAKQVYHCNSKGVGQRDLLIQLKMLFVYVFILHFQTVFLGQLSHDTSEDQIREFFKQHEIGEFFELLLIFRGP